MRPVSSQTGQIPNEHILVVEDDIAIARGMVNALEAAGYVVAAVGEASAAIAAVTQRVPALVLLDLGLPDGDGIDVCRALRVIAPAIRIVIVTARADESDIVRGLDAGGDDYLIKPFRLTELLARVRAHLRSASGAESPTIQTGRCGDIRVDPGARRVFIDNIEIELRPKEFDLLALFVGEAGRVVTREQILETIWDEHWFGSTKTLDMHVSAIRKKMVGSTTRITTLRGVGYRLDP